jgi:hypothetical protein
MEKVIFLLLLSLLVTCTSFNCYAQSSFSRSLRDGASMAEQADRNRMEQERNRMEQIRVIDQLERTKMERERLQIQKQLYELEIERQKLELENRKLELELQKSRGEASQMSSRDLTDDEKKYLVNHYREKGKKLKIGNKLEAIKVYDQGFVLPYECVVDGKENTIVVIAFEKRKPSPSQFVMISRDNFITIMKKDGESIQREAVAAFPKLYKHP